MRINKLVKKVLGEKGIQTAVHWKKMLCLVRATMNGSKDIITIKDTNNYQLYHIDGKNVFFGYYDLKSFNRSGNKLIAHIVDKAADPAVDPAQIAWFEPGDTSPRIIGETKAWCWQQGARLRWHPVEPDVVLYNDFVDDQYVLRKTDVYSGKSEIIGCGVYDIDSDMKYGVTLNFSRLQCLRPGYGYLNIPDPYENIKAPVDDGVFLVDMKSGVKKLLYSLSELAETVNGDGYHYINHLSIAPNGQSFIFFHIWTQEQGWKMKLYASDILGTELRILTENDVVSHYCWVDNENLIITMTSGEYFHLNINSGRRRKIEGEHLNRDGHPSKYREGFITDTYPLKNQMQQVFYCNFDGTGYHELARVFSNPLKYGEHRCDLHPRVESDGRITVDTTAIGGVRSILEFNIN